MLFGRRSIDVVSLAESYLDAGDPAGWFEPVYAAARGKADRVPWVHGSGSAHPYVRGWLDDPVVSPPGSRAVVVGAGLGDDAALLAERGYEVVAFDISETAIAWARRRHGTPVDWRVANLVDLPDDFGTFDLVVEVATVAYLPGVVRDAAMHAIGTLARPDAVAVTIGPLKTSADVTEPWDGPPWPQVPSELAAYRSGGLERVAFEHADPDEDGMLEFRATWQRTANGQDAQPGGRLPLF